MPSWKKVIISGSNAVLSTVSASSFTGSFTGSLLGTASYATTSSYALTSSYVNPLNQNVTITGSLLLTSSAISQVNYIDFDTGSATPTWKSGRVFFDNTEGALSVYNFEQDVTLQVGQENWTRVRNNTGTTITNGTVVRLSGSQGDVPTIEKAQSIPVSGAVNLFNQILGVATHDIENNSNGFVTTQGLVRGLNTNAYTEGSTLFVSQSAGLLTNIPPSAPYEIIPVGICVKQGPGGSGILYVVVQQPIDFSDLSSVKVTGSYNYGDIWTYIPSGSFGVWSHQKQLSGSYAVTGSWSATSFTGSLLGTASNATTASYALTSSYVLNAISASYATTASYVLNAVSASFATSASYALSSSFALSSSRAVSSSYALSSSYSLTATSASYALTSSNVLGGTTNYIPLWNSATTLTSSVMYQSSSAVGINTLIPSASLQVEGTTVATSSIGRGGYFNATVSASSNNDILIGLDTTLNTFIGLNTGSIKYAFRSNGPAIVSSAGTSFKGGYPTKIMSVLHVRGTNSDNDASYGGITLTTSGINDGIYRMRLNGNDSSGAGEIGVPYGYPLNLQAGGTYWGNGAETGNVLIGGASNTAKLAVKGNGSTSSTTNLLLQNSSGNTLISVLNDGTTTISGSTTITGSLTVITGSNVEFQVLNTGVKIGNIITDIHNVTGSLRVSGSITGSLLGTASFATSASYALSSSYALSASFAPNTTFPYTGSARITGSLIVTGSIISTLNITASRALISSSNGTVSGSTLVVYGSGSANPVFTVQGSQGELFSITDSLSGSLFSVNDISGLPILEVFSDSTTLIGNYQAPALYTTVKLSSISGSNVIYSLPTGSYDGVFVDYTLKSGSNARAGQVMGIWSGSSANYTDNSTTDFGTTAGFAFAVIVSGSNMVVTGSSTTAGWTVKTIIRSI
jgi:hypothetical protein